MRPHILIIALLVSVSQLIGAQTIRTAEDLENLRAPLKMEADQFKKLSEGIKAHQRDLIRLQADCKIADLDLQQLVESNIPDLSLIDLQVDKVAQCRANMHKADIRLMLDQRKILTPDQNKEFRRIHEARQLREQQLKQGKPNPGTREMGAGYQGSPRVDYPPPYYPDVIVDYNYDDRDRPRRRPRDRERPETRPNVSPESIKERNP